MKITLEKLRDAQKTIHQYIEPSPLIRNSWLSEHFGCDLYLKLENMQPIGSFKIRGALYRISRLTAAERKRGVVAASAGNHAQGVAWASRRLGVKALIVMPKGAPLVKIQNTRAFGAEIHLAGENYEEALAEARKVVKKTGRVMIHAFEDEDVILGQGTLGLELMKQIPDLDMVVGSIGGGGLMSGVSAGLKELKPKVQIIGCQAAGAASMVRSIRKHRIVSTEKANTFADGIAVTHASPKMMKLLEPRVDLALEASDEAIAAAILMLLEKAKTVVEGAGALPLAVLENIRPKIRGKKVVLILSGGNIDVNLLSRIIDRGLIRAGRRVRVNVVVSDRPGSLARLTEMIGSRGANILQAIHDRSEPSTTIDQTDVALTLETRGPEHSAELIRTLKKEVIRLEVVH